MSDPERELSEVISAFSTNLSVVDNAIELAVVRKLLRDLTSIEAQGALCSHILNTDFSSRISPPLEFSDFHPFVSDYFLRCVREDPAGQWSDSRYGAGIALANWFKGLVDDKTVPRQALADIQHSIAMNWDAATNDGVKNGILNGVLEHIFEDYGSREYFSDWRLHSKYSALYDAACQWSDHSD